MTSSTTSQSLNTRVIPKSQDPIALPFEPTRALVVVLLLLGVLAAVQIENELRFEADKIDDVMTERDLAAKLEAREPASAELIPNDSLGIGHVLAKLASIFKGHDSPPEKASHAAPLSPCGRGEGGEGYQHHLRTNNVADHHTSTLTPGPSPTRGEGSKRRPRDRSWHSLTGNLLRQTENEFLNSSIGPNAAIAGDVSGY